MTSLPGGFPGGRSQRATYQVVDELIADADRSLVLMSYVFHPETKPLVERLASRRLAGVDVTVCLNNHSRNAHRFLAEWPSSTPPPRVLVPDRERWTQGSFHPKVVIQDRERALVTSANLTGWATDKNIETGLLVEGAPARELHGFFIELQEGGYLVEIEDTP